MRIVSNIVACFAIAGAAILSILLAITLACMGTSLMHDVLMGVFPFMVALLLTGVCLMVGIMGVSAVMWYVARPMFDKVSKVMDDVAKFM